MRVHFIISMILVFAGMGASGSYAADLATNFIDRDGLRTTQDVLDILDEDNECQAIAAYKSLQCHQRYLNCLEDAVSIVDHADCTLQRDACYLILKLDYMECKREKLEGHFGATAPTDSGAR